MGIFLIPMPVIINDETHYEGIDLTETSFYESLTGGKNVSTSQPSPGDLMDLWDDIFEQGYDEIIHIPMSSGLSASCSSAISLSADYEGKVQVADNHRISVTQRESVMHAKKLAEAGKSAKERAGEETIRKRTETPGSHAGYPETIWKECSAKRHEPGRGRHCQRTKHADWRS